MTDGERESSAPVSIPAWNTLRRPLALILAVVVVTVAAWAAVANYVVVARDPRAPVDAYLGHLENGSSRQVLAPLLVGGGQNLAQLLPNRVYRAAADRPVGHDVVGTMVQGRHAVVSVDVHLGGGSTVRRTYTVEQVSAWGPFNDAWRLLTRDDTSVEVRMPGPLDALAVNGEKVRPDAGHVTSPDSSRPHARAWRFEALPGRYDVALPGDSYLLTKEHATAAISLTDPRPAVTEELTVAPSPRMWQSVETEVQRTLGACERDLQFDAASCPVPRELARATSSASGTASASPDEGGLPGGVSNVRWEVTSRPSLLLQPDAEEPLAFHAARFRATQAKVTWLENGRQRSGTVRFGIDVSARSTGEELTTEVRLRSALTDAEK